MNNGHGVVFVRGRSVKINKLQTAVVTEKVIRQLNAEPKVVITVNSALRASIPKKDRNVEDTSVSHDQNVSPKSKNGDDSSIDPIESALDKMHSGNNEPSTIHKEPSKTHSKRPHKVRKVQKETARERCIRIFGSPLDDIIEEKKNQPRKIKTARRHTLPVSIPRELLIPSKVIQKRKSANDVISTLCQSQRFAIVCELPKLEVTQLLAREEVIRQRIRSIVVTSDLESATIMEEPSTGVPERVKRDVMIDLTEDDSDLDDLVIDTSTEEDIKEEVVKEEPSMSSETASVPTQAPSMPLLSPESPAQATQREATLPETSNTCASSQRPPPHIPVMVAPKPPIPRPRVPTKRPLQDYEVRSQPAKRPMVPAENQKPSNPVVADGRVNLEPPPSDQSAVRQPNQDLTRFLRPPAIVEPKDGEVRSQPSKRPMIPAESQKPSNQEAVPVVPPPSDQPAVRQPNQFSRPPVIAEPNKQISSVPESVKYQQAPQGQVQAHSYFSNLRMLLDKTSQPAPERRHSIEKSANIPRVTIHQSNLSQPRPQLQATVSSILQTAQHQASMPQTYVQLPQYPGLQAQPNRVAPQLIRMLRPTRTQYEFHLISNAACGERLVPHVMTMARWKDSAIRFCNEVQTYLTSNDFKQDYSVFCIYINQTLTNFGKKLIRELSSIEVENFDLGEVCTVISRKLLEQNCSASIYRVCFNIHAMIKSCENFCLTPFTRKFFYNVKACVEKMEEKTQKGRQAPPLFTLSQLKQLELQIQQYIHIQMWLDFVSASSNRSQLRPHHRTTSKKQQKKSTDTNTLLRATQQNQNAPDLTQVVAPRVQSSFSSGVEKSQSQPQLVPSVRVVIPQPPILPAEVPAIPQQSPSREASVIVFTPTEAPSVENRTEEPVVTKTEQKQDDEIIDLTWIDDGDESAMLEEFTESNTFPCKIENYPEAEPEEREVVSPADSGLGSPHSQTDEPFKCLCGKQAIYVCACNSSMYCGKECQMNDWAYHQRLCQDQENAS